MVDVETIVHKLLQLWFDQSKDNVCERREDLLLPGKRLCKYCGIFCPLTFGIASQNKAEEAEYLCSECCCKAIKCDDIVEIKTICEPEKLKRYVKVVEAASVFLSFSSSQKNHARTADQEE